MYLNNNMSLNIKCLSTKIVSKYENVSEYKFALNIKTFLNKKL